MDLSFIINGIPVNFIEDGNSFYLELATSSGSAKLKLPSETKEMVMGDITILVTRQRSYSDIYYEKRVLDVGKS